jgi:FAD/FMN-containing dehydrogenase
MDELVGELRTRLGGAYPGQQHLFFGHLGDGNLHLISGPFRHQAQLEHAEELVYATVGAFQGSISAEHGIGTVKRPFLHQCRRLQRVARLLAPELARGNSPEVVVYQPEQFLRGDWVAEVGMADKLADG